MKKLSSLLTAVALAVVTAACAQTDAGLTSKVKSKLAADDLVKAHEINVTTTDHVVTLTGSVQTPAVKAQAVRLARETEGVRDVVDDLHVEVAATTGELDDDVTIDVDVDNDVERGAKATGNAVKKGAEATADAAKKVGGAVRDAVTDDDRDSDNDGK